MTSEPKKPLERLTLEEKAGLCSGQDFWNTKAVGRLGIPSWTMTDGPHGLRKQNSDGLGLLDSVPATCFPSGVALASSWNRELIQQVGEALGREAKASQVGVLLGPAVNIKRSPLCGRNFEYFSEDPYLAGQMAKHHILGVQSQGVGASLKHFAANNQEKLRMTINAVVDERALREIYLPAFETAVKEAGPWTVMCSYNRINGTYAAENRWLLTQVLKEEWGHTGLVVTDWGACNDRVEGIKAGLDLEMPGNGGINDRAIVEAVRAGKLDESELDLAVSRVLEVTERVQNGLDKAARFDAAAHHALARRAAAEGMVLLKNEGNLLPLTAKSVAFIGAFARHARYQGGGSSHITPTRLDDAWQEAGKLAGGGVSFAPGYVTDSEATDKTLLDEAVKTAATVQVAVVFIGLTDPLESEGYDRKHLRLPASHVELLEAVLAVQKNVVVVLSNGSPVEMPWLDRVPSVLEGYLGGQAWGGAVADLLFGKVCPSGKLAETFPKRLEDTPSYLNFPGDGTTVEYREGIFVGYRYHDAAHVEPLFPFGHGLSYTSFRYGPLVAAKDRFDENETVAVELSLTNTGRVAGAEVVQLYVSDLAASVLRPVRELKAFAKVFLEPGETKAVSFKLDRRAFAWWSGEQRWVVESGEFELWAASSSRDLRSHTTIILDARSLTRGYSENSTVFETLGHPGVGKLMTKVMNKMIASFGTYEEGSASALMMEAFVKEFPLRNLTRMSRGMIPETLVPAVLAVLNDRAGAESLPLEFD